MRGIEVVTSEGPAGPAYVQFSRNSVARTEPTEIDDEVIVDYDADGSIVGIELVSISNETISALLEVARRNELDLSALLSRSFAAPSAA
ncbi:MAG: DUF2283 domain-containing protein [Candidatus Baltobacteraceae bacterium]